MGTLVLLLVGLSSGQVVPAPLVRLGDPGAKQQANPEPGPENLQTFDTGAIRLAWVNRHWQLLHRGVVLKDFGPREQEARQGLRLMQELGLTQHGVIGNGPASMEYWLSNGHAPQGQMRTSLRSLPIDTNSLRVEQIQGQWCLRDASRVLFNFGPQMQDAHQALAVARKYHFDQIALLGQGTPSMYVFMSRQTSGTTPTLAPGGHHTSNASQQMKGPHFSRLAKNADGSPRFQPTKTPSSHGLEGVVSPAVPNLANLGNQPLQGESHAFRWRMKPGFDSRRLAAPTDDRVPFDWRQVQLRQDGPDWKMVAGSLELANFGGSFNEARLALSALRHYRFGEQWRLGGATPYLTYYAAPGSAPRGVMLGLTGEEFKPDQLQVKQVENGYALCQGTQVVVRLRQREEDARKLLETIKRQRYDRVCKVGGVGKEPMTLLVRSR